jgi:hypothetical protein
MAGLFKRSDTAALEAMADNIQSYCDTGDTFCACKSIRFVSTNERALRN